MYLLSHENFPGSCRSQTTPPLIYREVLETVRHRLRDSYSRPISWLPLHDVPTVCFLGFAYQLALANCVRFIPAAFRHVVSCGIPSGCRGRASGVPSSSAPNGKGTVPLSNWWRTAPVPLAPWPLWLPTLPRLGGPPARTPASKRNSTVSKASASQTSCWTRAEANFPATTPSAQTSPTSYYASR